MEIRIMIVDDQPLAREGLKKILRLYKDIKLVGTAENGKDALEKIVSLKPEVVVSDIKMPVMDGVELTRNIKQKHPQVRVLILTTFDEEEYIIEALKAGAEGYILKDLAIEKLVDSIRDVYLGNAIMQPEIAAKLAAWLRTEKDFSPVKQVRKETARDFEELTQREKDVVKLLVKGFSNKEIGSTLSISEGTVKNYISNIYEKLGVNSRSKLILYVMENKFFE